MVGPHAIINGLHGVGLARAHSRRLSPTMRLVRTLINRSALPLSYHDSQHLEWAVSCRSGNQMQGEKRHPAFKI